MRRCGPVFIDSFYGIFHIERLLSRLNFFISIAWIPNIISDYLQKSANRFLQIAAVAKYPCKHGYLARCFAQIKNGVAVISIILRQSATPSVFLFLFVAVIALPIGDCSCYGIHTPGSSVPGMIFLLFFLGLLVNWNKFLHVVYLFIWYRHAISLREITCQVVGTDYKYELRS